MNAHSRQFVLPLFIIVVGIGWLMNALNVYAPVNWFWSALLATSGILLVALAGIDRFTAVVGPWLICASCTNVLREAGVINGNLEMPLLTIAMGVLIFISRLFLPRMISRVHRQRA